MIAGIIFRNKRVKFQNQSKVWTLKSPLIEIMSWLQLKQVMCLLKLSEIMYYRLKLASTLYLFQDSIKLGKHENSENGFIFTNSCYNGIEATK